MRIRQEQIKDLPQFIPVTYEYISDLYINWNNKSSVTIESGLLCSLNDLSILNLISSLTFNIITSHSNGWYDLYVGKNVLEENVCELISWGHIPTLPKYRKIISLYINNNEIRPFKMIMRGNRQKIYHNFRQPLRTMFEGSEGGSASIDINPNSFMSPESDVIDISYFIKIKNDFKDYYIELGNNEIINGYVNEQNEVINLYKSRNGSFCTKYFSIFYKTSFGYHKVLALYYNAGEFDISLFAEGYEETI